MKTDIAFPRTDSIVDVRDRTSAEGLSLCLLELEREAMEIGATVAAHLIGVARLELDRQWGRLDA